MATIRNGSYGSGNGRRSSEWFDRRRPRRLPAPILAEVDRGEQRDLPRAAGDRHLQQLERARQLQRAPPRPRAGGQARRPPGRRLPGRVPGDLARGVADEADDNAVPEPDGDGRRGVDPLLPARRRRPAHRLRQDQPGLDHGRGQCEHPGDRRHRWADAERPLARTRAGLLLRLLALPRGAARRTHHGDRVRGDRERDVALQRALHDDGHRVDDGLRDRGARVDLARRGCDPRRRLPPALRSPRPRDGRSSSSSSGT